MAPKKKSKKGSKVDLYIAMYEDGDNYKHWALYIDNPNNRTILHVQGSVGRWRYEEKNDHNPEDSRSFHALVYVATIYKSRIPELIAAAEALPLQQTKATWNCQNYVLDLIAEADGDLFDISDDEFRALCRRMDGLV